MPCILRWHPGKPSPLALSGGSVNWANTTRSQTATYVTWTESKLKRYKTITFTFKGRMVCSTFPNDSCTNYLRLELGDGTIVNLKSWYMPNSSNYNESFTVNIKNYTDEQLATVKVQCYGEFNYDIATNRYTGNQTTISDCVATA